jgi:GDP-L-fucose synthase
MKRPIPSPYPTHAFPHQRGHRPEDCTIRELAETIAKVTGFSGRLTFDTSKPDGTPRKLLDVSKLKSLGWEPVIGLEQGLTDAYAWFVDHQQDFRQ